MHDPCPPHRTFLAPLLAVLAVSAGACARAGDAATGGSASFSGSNGDGTDTGTGTSDTGTASGSGASGTAGATGSSGAPGSGSEGSDSGTAGGACAGAPFRVDVPNVWLYDVVATGDSIVGAGYTEGIGARLVAFDPCDGTLLDEATSQFEGNTGTRWTRIGWVGDVLVAAGDTPTLNDPGQGLYARIVPATLQPQWEIPIGGSSGLDEIFGMAGEAGRVFLVGHTNAPNATPWLVTADTSGSACGFSWTPQPGANGEVRAATVWQGNAVVAAHVGGAGYLLRYPLDCACPCNPGGTFPIDLGLGEDDVVINALATAGNQVLAAGVYWTGGNVTDLRAVITALSPLSGTASATWTDSPTAMGDGWVTAVVGDGFLIVGGVKGWDGVSPTFVGASAWGLAFPLPLTDGAAPTWTFEPAGVDALQAADVDEARSTVYFVGGAGGESVLMACTTDGTCPP